MQVFLQIVSFSLQTDGSGRPVLTKGKRPQLLITCSCLATSLVVYSTSALSIEMIVLLGSYVS